MRRVRLALGGLVLSMLTAAQAEDAVRVEDLAYGEALFHYFKQDYLMSGVHLMVAKEQDRLEGNRDDAELLLGGLQLSYGMYRAAAETLNGVLAAKVSPRTRNRAWYFLARLAYRRGSWDEARAALERIDEDQSPESAAQTALLRGLVALAADNPGDAVAVLSQPRAVTSLTPYLDYNLGVAQLRSRQREAALSRLNRLGTADATSAEEASVRDRANLAAAFAELQAGRPDDALRYFQRVRLQESNARLALLGAGWAAAENADHPLALTMWSELVNRTPRDAAVLEALFAIPYAYVQMDDPARAAQHYENAITTYLEERARLDANMALVREDAFLDRLIASTRDGYGVPRVPELQRLDLPDLIASHTFREAWKGYRDLKQLEANLLRWRRSLGAFDTMLATRKARFDQVVPTIEQRLGELDVRSIRTRERQLSEELERVRRDGDVWRLASGDQLALRQELRGVEVRIGRLAGGAERRALVERIQRLTGVLYWRVHARFPARLWETTKAVRELQAQFQTLDARLATLGNARRFADSRLGDLATRVQANGQRVEMLLPRVERALTGQKRHLTRLVLGALDERRAYLESYLLQARYALAQLYDKAQSGVREP